MMMMMIMINITEPAEEVKEINSEEEPHRVVHNVYRPVIQEVTEVVQPFRKVIQKVEPVIEEMKTIISKAAPQDGLPVVPHQQEQLHHQQPQINQALNTFETLNDRSKFSIFSSSSSSPSSDSNLNRFTGEILILSNH